MYCISDTDFYKDFNMILNDTIIDCFLDSSDIIECDRIKIKEFDAVYDVINDESCSYYRHTTPAKKQKPEKTEKPEKQKKKEESRNRKNKVV